MLLLALAVIDDLGAIIVIAVFYSSGVAITGLLVAALGIVGVFAMQRFGVRSKWAYIVPAFIAWAGVYSAGIHPTIAGVIIGLITPVRTWLGPEGFVTGARTELEHIAQAQPGELSSHHLSETLRRVDAARREAMSPSESLIATLHPWVAFGIMPVFALANAGVPISSEPLDAASWTVALATATGLLVGKPLGVIGACWLALRLRLATLPKGLGMRELLVLGSTAGIGFTMALFIAQLAFTETKLLAAGKLGVLAASGAAAVVALALGRWLLTTSARPGAARSVDEAERSTAL